MRGLTSVAVSVEEFSTMDGAGRMRPSLVKGVGRVLYISRRLRCPPGRVARRGRWCCGLVRRRVVRCVVGAGWWRGRGGFVGHVEDKGTW